MATATLKFVGPSMGLENIDVGYVIDGAVDFDHARATMMAKAPPLLGSFVPVHFTIEPLDGSDSLWDGLLTYGPRTTKSPDGENDPTYAFEISVQSTRVTTSLETVASYGEAPKPDFKRSINVQDDLTVDGVDLNFPVYSWTETHYLKNSFVTRAYFRTLFNLTAKMNAGAFRDFARGEVLLLGCNGSKRARAVDWEMQFKFIASPNVTNLKVGPDITVTEKLGHDYLWVRYKAASQTDDGMAVMAKIPKHVFVERVYEFEDMNKLKLRNPLAL